MAMEKDTGRLQFRIARDFLLDQSVFPLAATYPLPDIPVAAQNQVVFSNKTGKVLLQPFQTDTTYQLKDDLKQDTGIDPAVDGTTLVLETDVLTKEEDDYTYTITGTKNKSGLSKQLLRAVTLRVGVDVNIVPVVQTAVIEFGKTVDILLPGTQNGATYQVLSADGATALSKSVNSGEGGDLVITTYAVSEDTPFQVKVMKTKTPGMFGFIVWKEGNPEMVIRVYPNDQLTPVVTGSEAGIVYGKVAEIALEGAQESVDYQLLYQDVDDDSVDKNVLLNTAAGKSVKGKASGLVLKTEKLTEDPTIVILATKRESGITRVLPNPVFVPVQPDPDKRLTVVESAIAAGGTATIQVNKPQRGIYYQLLTPDNKEVGWRVYYHKNYGVGKARVGIELAVDTKDDDTVYLSTGPLSQDTVFKVVAKKATTGKTVEITGTIAVTLTE
jgi:hypothetical protein